MELDHPQRPQKSSKPIRKPMQSRSIQMKEKILESALELFCDKGYYNTTTNEIAQRAQVSIGSFYSYFKDKDTIFIEILEKYNEKFEMAKSEILNDPNFIRLENKKWLRMLIESLIKVHEETKELNRELTVLSFYNPKIAEIMEKNRKKNLNAIVSYFKMFEIKSAPPDLEAAAIKIFDLFSSTVDRIVFGKNEMDKDRLIEATVDIAYKYFMT